MSEAELPKDVRSRMLAKIHIAKKQLGLDDENYRAILLAEAGVESAKDLTAAGLVKVMERFVELGFKVEGKPSPRPSPRGRGSRKLSPQSRDKPELEKTQQDKIRALWISGAQLGVIRNRSESALNRFVSRRFGCDRVEWLTSAQAQKVIEAIKQMVERGEKR